MNSSFTRPKGIRRFITIWLLVSLAVLVVGLAGSFILLRQVEEQLRTNQTQAAMHEATVISRFIDRNLEEGTAPEQTILRVQNVLKGTGSQADFVCLLDQEGRVISHPDESKVGMPWGEMDMVRLDTKETVPISSALDQRESVAALQSDHGDPMQLVYYQPVEMEPWTIAVHRNTAVIDREFAATRAKLLSVVIPALLLMSFIGVWLARSLGARYEQALAQKNAELEKRVNERTAELQKTLGELEEAHEKLLQGEKMHLLGELMAGIAHEINNPLAVISGYADMLAMGDYPDSIRAGELIRQQNQRVCSIVRNLLDFANNRPASYKPGSLNTVLKNSEELIAAELRSLQIKLETSISPKLPSVQMDTQQMEQVFINLLRNAGQALAEQKGQRHISVRAFTDGEWNAVLIRDNGPGIPEEMRAKVFDSFVTTKTDGTGLGLSLCKRFVEAHGGQLELVPSNGQPGACFQIRLPVFEKEVAQDLNAKPALA